MSFFKKYPLSFSFLYWFILTGHLSSFSFIFCSNIFPCVCVQLKFLRTRKLYSARFITQLGLYHPTCVMICRASFVTRFESKCISLCTPARVAIINHTKSFPIIRNDLRLIEMKSSHSKTAMTILALRPLHRKMLTRITPNTDTFHAVINFSV